MATWIDHVYVLSELVQSIRAAETLDVVSNLSDLCVYSVCLSLKVDLCMSYANMHASNKGCGWCKSCLG